MVDAVTNNRNLTQPRLRTGAVSMDCFDQPFSRFHFEQLCSFPIKPSGQLPAGEIKPSSPGWSRKPCAINFNKPTNTPVVHLFFWCCPITVCWRIVSVIINTIERMFGRWSWPHILVKVLKAIQPPFTYSNPSSTIYFPLLVVGVEASTVHRLPSSVFRST